MLYPAYREGQRRRAKAAAAERKRQRVDEERQEREASVAPEVVEAVRDMWQHYGYMNMQKIHTEFWTTGQPTGKGGPTGRGAWYRSLPQEIRTDWKKLWRDAEQALAIVRRERREAGLPVHRAGYRRTSRCSEHLRR